jgi:hypothetical protein
VQTSILRRGRGQELGVLGLWVALGIASLASSFRVRDRCRAWAVVLMLGTGSQQSGSASPGPATLFPRLPGLSLS